MKQILLMLISMLMLPSCSKDDSVAGVEPPAAVEPSAPTSTPIRVTIGDTTFTATLSSGATVTAFKAFLPLTLTMSDFNSNEKVASLPRSLTTAASNPGTIHTGDIMLYGSSSLVVFYETFSTSYSYTRIGRIDNSAGLKAALGAGNVTLKFELE